MNVYEKSATIRAGSTPGQPAGIPVGSGPYQVEKLGAESITFTRNKYYNGEKPKAAKVVVHFIADNATRLAALEAGEIDGTFQVPATEVERWEKPSISLLSVPNILFEAFRFNMHHGPFDDVHARRAVMYAFDRPGVVEKILHGNGRVANTLQAPETWANEGLSASEVEARSDELGQQYPYDPEKAKAELEKSKDPNGFSTSVTYSAVGNPELALAMQVLQQNLKEVGIDLKLNPVSEAQMAPEYSDANPKYEILAQFGAPGYPSGTALLNEVLCSCVAPPNGTFNTGYDNPSLNKMISAANADLNPETRADKVFEIMAIGNRDIPFPTLWWLNSIAATSKDLVLEGFGPWSELNTAWMANLAAAGQE
jgi:peptide/nickel transport system substrate-binding protein